MAQEQWNLHPIIARNLAQMGYAQPRPIQVQAAGPILERRDVIGLAKTGSGKTAAFIAPLAHHLISAKPPRGKGRPIDPMTRLRALVLCPTRELAQQIANEAGAIIQGSVLRVVAAYGKVAITPQAQAIARGVDLLIATPGRVRELLDAGALSLAYVKYVAIDEADRMLDMGFLPQVQQILQMIPFDRQTVLFTSTMPAEVEELARQFLREPARIEVDRHTTPVEHVQQHLVPVEDDAKVGLLLHLIQQRRWFGVLVFCRTRRRVGWVGEALRRNEVSTGVLHGDMSQAQRKRALDRFANGELRVLVASDVAGRGLHVPAVKTVVNYDLPLTPEEYVHRIGRAAHGSANVGGVGEAFTFLALDKTERLRWRSILDALGVEVYAEVVEGFVAPNTRHNGGRPAVRTADEDRPISRRTLRREARRPRLSKKSRPIKKGEAPGKGVIRAGSKRNGAP